MIISKTFQSERIAILVVAYYNLGVEMEFLKKVIVLIFHKKGFRSEKNIFICIIIGKLNPSSKSLNGDQFKENSERLTLRAIVEAKIKFTKSIKSEILLGEKQLPRAELL